MPFLKIEKNYLDFVQNYQIVSVKVLSFSFVRDFKIKNSNFLPCGSFLFCVLDVLSKCPVQGSLTCHEGLLVCLVVGAGKIMSF